MAERPYLLVSCAMSVDGHIDDASGTRLILSSDADADRVDEVRAGCDAILVGAGTIRRDNPRLLIRSADRRARRVARGLSEQPVKATLTATGDLDPAARFFSTGGGARLVYCARPALPTARARLSGVAELIDAGDPPSLVLILNDLAERGVARVLLEGGGQLATEFLTAGLADELHLVIAPFFVGDPTAPRFAGPGCYPNGPASRMQLAESRQLGDVVLVRYLLATRQPGGPPATQVARPAQTPEPPGTPRPAQVGWPTRAPEPTHTSEPPGGPADAERRRPTQAPEPGGPAAADIRRLREMIERLDAEERELHTIEPPGGPAAAEGRRPARAAEPSGPAAANVAWLRETIDVLGAQERQPARTPEPRGAHARRPAHTPDSPGGPAAADFRWLRETIELSRRCPPSRTAFSVGAVIVGADGTPLATGFSREADPRDHAEEAALGKLSPGDPRLATATMYSSLEPCGVRASRPRPCAELIIAAGLRRVVYAWHEPPLLAAGGGAEMLRAAGISVTQVAELAAEARQVNAHLVGP